MANLLEEAVRDLPEFLNAGRIAEARGVAGRDEIEGWLYQFADWGNRAAMVAAVIEELWFDVPHSLRAQTLNMMPPFLESGTIGMRAIVNLLDSLNATTAGKMHRDLTFYWDAVMLLMGKIWALVDEENVRRTAFQTSTTLSAKSDAAFEVGKREAASGKLTYFTPDEFLKRFG